MIVFVPSFTLPVAGRFLRFTRQMENLHLARDKCWFHTLVMFDMSAFTDCVFAHSAAIDSDTVNIILSEYNMSVFPVLPF